MKNVLKHLKSFAVIVPLCVLLILTQAVCELNIPRLWGDIVDVGMRQNGLGAGAPEAISRSGLDLLKAFMTSSDKEFIESVYYSYEPESSEAQRLAAQYPLAIQEPICVLRGDVQGLTRSRADNAYANAAHALLLYLEQDGAEMELENLQKKYEIAKRQAEQGVLEDPIDPSGEGVIGEIPDGAIIAGLEGFEGMSATGEVEVRQMSAETGSNLMETQQPTYGTDTQSETPESDNSEISEESSVENSEEITGKPVDEITGLNLNEFYELLPLLQALPAESVQDAISDAKFDRAAERTGSVFKKLFYEEVGIDVTPARSEYINETVIRLVAVILFCLASLILACVLAERLSKVVGKKLIESLESRVESFDEDSPALHLVARAANDVRGVQKLTDLLIRLALYVPVLLICGTVFAARSSVSGGFTAVLVIVAVLAVIFLAAVAVLPQLIKKPELSERLKLEKIEKFLEKLAERLFGDTDDRKLLSKQNILKLVGVGAVSAVTLLMSLICAVVVPAAGGAIESSLIEVGGVIAFVQHIVQLLAAVVLTALLFTTLRSSVPALIRIKDALFPQKEKRGKSSE